MAANVYGLHVFANDVGPEPLALLDQNYDALVTALNTLSTYSNAYTDSGTTNQLTVQTPSTQFASLTDGLQVIVRIAATNTGAATFNLNNLGAQPILNTNGSQLVAGQLLAGSQVLLTYNAQRQAWQLGTGSGGGVLTEPFLVTDPNGNRLLWADSSGTGAAAPFSVKDSTNNTTLFYDGMAGLNVSAGPPGSRALDIFGGVNANPMVAQIHSGNNTAPGSYILWVGATDDVCQPGCSFGEYIMAGTNQSDISLQVVPLTYASVTGPPYGVNPNNSFLLMGDRSGAIGPAPNQLVWDTAGHFTLTGTATLPMPPLVDLPGITITNPQQGDVLSYNSGTNQWVNAAPVTNLAHLTDVALNALVPGQMLIWNNNTQQWVNSTPVTQLQQLSNVTVAGPAPGQVLTYSVTPNPGWINATIPNIGFLNSLSIQGTPQAGYVLTWDGNGWVGAPPGQVASFPLSSLTDVNIQNPLNRQVLTWDAPNSRWINAPAATPSLATLPDVSLTSQTQGQVLAWNAMSNRWENSPLPGGSVIALDTLMDTNISDPQNNQVLTWNYASSRWVNQNLPTPVTALSALTDVTLNNPVNGQTLAWNGTHWVNQTPVSVTVAATAPANPQSGWLWWDTNGGQLYVWYSGQWVVANPTGPYSLMTLSDVSPTAAVDGQVLMYNAAPHQWMAQSYFGAAYGSNDRFYWDGVGHFYFGGNAVAGGTSNPPRLRVAGQVAIYGNANDVGGLSVYGGANTVNQSICAMVGSPSAAAGTCSGLYLQAGTNSNDAPLRVYLMNGVQPMVIRGDGTGGIGPTQPHQMSWDTYGSFVFPQTSAGNWGSTVRITASDNGYGLYVGGGNNTVVNRYLAALYTKAGPPGTANGMYIEGQDDGQSVVIQCSNNLGMSLFQVSGTGAIWAPNMSTNPGGYPAVMWQGGQLTYVASAARFKTNVRSLARERARDFIRRLRAVTFNSLCKADDPQRECYGLIAEEVEAVDPRLVVYDDDGKPLSVKYDSVFLMLLPLVQELLEERG